MSQQQPSFLQIGKIVRAIANHAAYALGFSIIAGIASAFSVVSSPHVALAGFFVIATLCVIAFFRTLVLTRDLMSTIHVLGDDRNIMQFKLFTRFLFNSMAAGLIGFFWAVISVIIMFAPALFPTPAFNWYIFPWPSPVMASMAGEIALCIVAIVFGLAYIPHSYKAWKLVDDYFVLLHDPWSRDIGLLGTKKILDGHKVAFATTFFTFGAIGYHAAAFIFFVPTIAICALVAGVKHIQGLYRVGTGFTRIPASALPPWYQQQPAMSPGRVPGTYLQPAQPSSAPQPAYFRYQPSQALYNRDAAIQGSPPPDPLANATGIQGQIIRRNQDFLHVLDSDSPGQQRWQQSQAQEQPATASPAIAPSRLTMAPPPPRANPMVAAAGGTAGSPGRCKYCMAELPSTNTGKCPGCGAALLSF
ncbi:MAG: hypothetical protein Q6365_022125 [Candidatus Sigynarchaeota archaeon]